MKVVARRQKAALSDPLPTGATVKVPERDRPGKRPLEVMSRMSDGRPNLEERPMDSKLSGQLAG